MQNTLFGVQDNMAASTEVQPTIMKIIPVSFRMTNGFSKYSILCKWMRT